MTNYLVPFADVDPNDLRPVEARPQRRNWLDYYSGPELSAALGRAAQLMEFLSPATDFVDALGASAETARGVVGGNPWETGAGLAGMGAALGSVFLPGSVGAADEVVDAGRKGIRAYHGSPHDFDRFDISKIGTGEGAQAYGHGLYFAENEGVARSYRNALQHKSSVPIRGADGMSANLIREAANYARRFPREERIARLMEHLAESEQMGKTNKYAPAGMAEAAQKAIQLMKDGEAFVNLDDAGRMYEVRINAEPDDFLDWDAPLSAQPSVASKIAADENIGFLAGQYKDHPAPMMALEYNIGARPDLFQDTKDYRGNAAAKLRELGIPGIRYYDAGSRGAGEGSRNYVVFDDSLIEIIRKYGLAGLALLGGLQALPQDEGEQY